MRNGIFTVRPRLASDVMIAPFFTSGVFETTASSVFTSNVKLTCRPCSTRLTFFIIFEMSTGNLTLADSSRSEISSPDILSPIFLFKRSSINASATSLFPCWAFGSPPLDGSPPAGAPPVLSTHDKSNKSLIRPHKSWWCGLQEHIRVSSGRVQLLAVCKPNGYYSLYCTTLVFGCVYLMGLKYL